MRYPVLHEIKQSAGGITRFTGLDHRLKARDTAFYDMRNMSGEKLPVMSTRRKRRYLRTLLNPNGLFAHDKLCWVDGVDFYYDGEIVGNVEDSDKQFVRMGAYVLIWPDAVYYNTETREFGALGARVVTEEEVVCHLCRADGNAYNYTISKEAPETPANGQYWLDTSDETHVLRVYSATQAMWNSVPTVYTKIEAYGIGKKFEKHDGVQISGMTLEALNGSFYIVDKGDDWIIVVALIDQKHEQTERVTVERLIPEMDYVCELNNRIWGCSNKKHEIYASALGDAKNWNQFIGQASDSYAVTVGSAGDFTGCCAHHGNMVFFKEECIHRIMGYKPANFQLDTTYSRGVQKGSSKSLCTVNETVLYKSRNDVCRLGNTMPSGISDSLGDELYTNAVAGAVNRRYYLCMRDAEGAPRIFVYDTEAGTWVAEDERDVMWFATLNGELYMLLTNGELWSAYGGGLIEYGSDASYEEEKIEWMLDTGDLGVDEPYNQHISGIQMYCNCELGTQLIVEVRCDDERNWRQAYRTSPATKRSITIPYVPPRCRTIRMRIRGTGDFQLYQIVKKIEQGSDVYGTC